MIVTEIAGGAGYSLLALIDANFPPVQLGWGFTLNGVGGLLAVHRSASTDALHAALKANTLSTILFPKNAITNAPQVLSTLDALFPSAPGRFLFGPMALIGWGTPTLLTAAIAVIIELPEPIRIVLIARLSAKIPSQSNALIRINLDALGVLDLSQDTLSLDATLFDSKLLQFTLSGDMALRANWSSTAQREFLLAIGGFNPNFTPPAGFPRCSASPSTCRPVQSASCAWPRTWRSPQIRYNSAPPLTYSSASLDSACLDIWDSTHSCNSIHCISTPIFPARSH